MKGAFHEAYFFMKRLGVPFGTEEKLVNHVPDTFVNHVPTLNNSAARIIRQTTGGVQITGGRMPPLQNLENFAILR